MVYWFGGRRCSRVEGPPRKNDRFKYTHHFFEQAVQEIIPKIKEDFNKGNIRIKTVNPNIEDILYLKAFIAFILINYVEIYNPEKGNDYILTSLPFGSSKIEIDLDGTKINFIIGGGLGYEWFDSRLPFGPFKYYKVKKKEEIEGEENFKFNSLEFEEKSGENLPIRIWLGGDTHDVEVEEHWASIGVEHHAYRDGHPINSTNKGFKKVEAHIEKRISPTTMIHDFYKNTFKFSKDIEEHKRKNDEILKDHESSGRI